MEINTVWRNHFHQEISSLDRPLHHCNVILSILSSLAFFATRQEIHPTMSVMMISNTTLTTPTSFNLATLYQMKRALWVVLGNSISLIFIRRKTLAQSHPLRNMDLILTNKEGWNSHEHACPRFLEVLSKHNWSISSNGLLFMDCMTRLICLNC